MAFIDALAIFSEDQAVTSTAISTNVYDLEQADLDIGSGEPVWLVIKTTTAATDDSSNATINFSLESDTAVGLDSGSATVHFSTGTLAFATFSPAGTLVAAIRLPVGDYKRYLGVRYSVASGPLTAGNFHAALVTDLDQIKAYPTAFTITG